MFNECKSEILRAFRVLGAERAYGQNWTDIHGWKKQGYLTYEEEKQLLSFNRIQYAKECENGNY